jgi:hypothetical protein
MSISPPLHFGNQNALPPHKVWQRKFSNHRDVILGNQHSKSNRLAREFAKQFGNGLHFAGLHFKAGIGLD